MKHLTILLLMVLPWFGYAQEETFEKIEPEHCGFDEEYMHFINSPDAQADYFAIFEENAGLRVASAGPGVMTCGRFRFVFEDVTLGLNTGFADPTNGAALRQCVCDVANYIQTVFNVPPGDGTPIDILIQQSSIGFASGVLATGGPMLTTPPWLANTSGFYGGNAYMHYVNGTDPDAGNIDGAIRVNFNWPFRICSQPRNCNAFDLYSVLLHEFSHVMGWFSNVGISGSTYASIYGSNKFSKYDQYFLYYGDIKTGPALMKMVNNVGPVINASVPTGALTGAQLWVHGHKRNSATLNQNIPAFANPGYFGGGNPPGTSSHLGDYQTGYMDQGYQAPGFVPNYVMAPGFSKNQIKDVWTNQELRMLNTMGYSYTAAYVAANPFITGNRHPYTTKEIYDYANWMWGGTYKNTEMDMNTASYTPADATISNCSTAVFTLSSDPLLFDADGDVKRIYPGSLYNIRGTSNGGINHNCLSVTSTASGDVITYTPRANFIGRAQFGFHLYDGKEKGEYMVYTIDVTGCNTCASNVVINGNFEEGEEIRTNANPTPDNSSARFYRNRNYEGLYSLAVLPDGVIYNGVNFLVTYDANGCTANDGAYGSPSWTTSTSYWNIPMSVPAGGQRFYAPLEDNTYFRLCTPMQQCKRYILEFDIYTNVNMNLGIGFTNTPLAQGGAIPLVNAAPTQVYSANPTWQHVVIPIGYCSATATNYLVFQPTGGINIFNIAYFIDNLDLHLDANQTFSASINPPVAGVCAGAPPTTITLSAVLTSPKCNVTYSWMPGGATTSSINVPSNVATTYTLTVNDGCSIAQATKTISTLAAPSVAASASPSNVCAVNPNSTLTATGSGVSFLWQPGSVPGNPIAVSPPGTTTYTVTATGANGCTNTATTTVNYVSCTPCTMCTPLSGVIGSGTYASTAYCVASTLTITGAVTISGSELQFSPSVAIIVAPGASLNIVNSHLYSCKDMWRGITVQNGGTLTISGSMVEDAVVAVDISNNTQTTPVLNISTSTFNRNYIGVNINNYSQMVSPYPFSITNCVFTCRTISFLPNTLTFPSWSTIGAAAVNPDFPLSNQWIDNSVYGESGGSAELKPPYLSTKSYAAINLQNVGMTINPTTWPTYYEFELGGAGLGNIIDNHYIGVNMWNSNFGSVGNTYQNTHTFSGGMQGGIGINSDSDPNNHNRVRATASSSGSDINSFVDCSRGIWAKNLFESLISDCDFRSTQKGPMHLNNTNTRGEYGIYINTDRYQSEYIGFNSMYNIENGITVIGNSGPITLPGVPAGTQQYGNSIYITDNVIQPQVTGYPVAQEFVANAIVVEDVYSGTPYSFGTPLIRVENNQITDAYRGINARNWTLHDVYIRWNVASMVMDQDMSMGIPTQYGINMVDCRPVNSHYVLANTVTGFGIMNQDVYGIYLRNMNQNVWCNITDQTTWGIVFEQKSVWTSFERNKMSNHKFGYVLLNNGEIGTQGSPTQPQDNEWLGAWPGGQFMTATLSSTAQNSVFYIRSTIPANSYNPDGSGFTTGAYSIDDYTLAGGPPTLFGTTSNPPPQNCFMFGKTTSVDEAIKTAKGFNAELYPNPAASRFSINLSGLTEGNIEVTVMDVTGKLVYQNDHRVSNSTAEVEINTATGVYFCRIVNKENNDVLTRKLIIKK